MLVAALVLAFCGSDERPGGLSSLSLPGWDARTATVYETRTGEIENIALSARTQFAIGAVTHVLAYHVRHLWTVDLHDGEAEFSQRDTSESLLVHAAGAVMVATDASFNVYSEPDVLVVTVITGVVDVEVYPAYWRGAEASEVVKTVVLRGGQGMTYHVFTREMDVGVGDVARATAWRRGRLEYLQVPLCRVIDDVNRYSSFRVELDSRAEDLLYSGSIILTRVESWTKALPLILPVRTEALAGGLGWRVVRKNSDPSIRG